MINGLIYFLLFCFSIVSAAAINDWSWSSVRVGAMVFSIFTNSRSIFFVDGKSSAALKTSSGGILKELAIATKNSIPGFRLPDNTLLTVAFEIFACRDKSAWDHPLSAIFSSNHSINFSIVTIMYLKRLSWVN